LSCAALHEDVEGAAVLVHRMPPIIAFTVDGQKDLIAVSLVPRARMPAQKRKYSHKL
jgi:hypothetical protein